MRWRWSAPSRNHISNDYCSARPEQALADDDCRPQHRGMVSFPSFKSYEVACHTNGLNKKPTHHCPRDYPGNETVLGICHRVARWKINFTPLEYPKRIHVVWLTQNEEKQDAYWLFLFGQKPCGRTPSVLHQQSRSGIDNHISSSLVMNSFRKVRCCNSWCTPPVNSDVIWTNLFPGDDFVLHSVNDPPQ